MYWQLLENRVTSFAHNFSFERIETPILEESALFSHAIGRETDIVKKELFEFVLKDGTPVALRPEGTAGVARAYINHGMLSLPQPVKLWYMGPMFRYDRPQAGRYRQLHQFGFEILGSDHPVLDAELVSMSVRFLKSLDISSHCLVNSIGCRVCRPSYLQKLLLFVRQKKRSLCADCNERMKKNVLRVLDCKEEKCQIIYTDAPSMVDNLCEDCKKHFTRVLEYLDEMNVAYTLAPRLVRGLDYYTRTVFELFPTGMPKEVPLVQENSSSYQEKEQEEHQEEQEENEEAPSKNPHRQDALAGGGRYDLLLEMLGGKPTPSLGVAFGMERILTLLKPKVDAAVPPKGHTNSVFLAQLGEKARKKMLVIKDELIQKGVKVLDAFSKDGLRLQLEIASRAKVSYALILGEKEVIEGTVILRDMNEGIQEIVPFEKIVEVISAKLAPKGSL